MSSGARLVIPGTTPVIDTQGNPVTNATLVVYNVGTTTPAAIFADEGLTTAILNPQISGADGFFFAQSTEIWSNSTVAYDAVLTYPSGTQGPYSFVNLWGIGQGGSTDGFLKNPNVVLTGIPTAPTPAVNDSSNQIATTAFVTAYGATISVIPSGVIQMFGSTTPPSGYLLCDGTAVSRTTYAHLFAEIGTNFGAGDGTTTFNLPDMGGYFPRGWTSSNANDPGRSPFTAQTANVGVHAHTLYVITARDSSQTTQNLSSHKGVVSDINVGAAVTLSEDSGTPPFVGPSSTGETRPINFSLPFIIKI